MNKIRIGLLLGLVVLLVVGAVAWHDATKPHTVTLTWQPGPVVADSTVVGYNVYRSVKSGMEYERLAARIPDAKYEDHTVSGGKTYYYVVSSVDQRSHESAYSAEIKVQVP